MFTLNPGYRAASSLKWGLFECVRLNGMTVRHRKHFPISTMLYMLELHANRSLLKLEAEMMRPCGTGQLRKVWRFRHGHKIMQLRHQSKGIPNR